MDDRNMITNIWGPHMWISLHSIAYCYPLYPTPEDKLKYKTFYELVGDMLPCLYCRESYKQFIKTGLTELTDSTMENRETLTKWLYYVHEAVNKKLGVNYGVSYNDVTIRYNSFRTSCHHDKKMLGCTSNNFNDIFKKYNSLTKECPIIPLRLARNFIPYARFRGLPESEFKLIYILSEKYLDFTDKLWLKRNKECNKLYNKMMDTNEQFVETAGKWADMPTINELRLIMRLSSHLSVQKLSSIVNKIPNCKCDYKKIYKIVEE